MPLPAGDRLAFRDDTSYGVESATVTLHMRGASKRSRHIEAARGSLGRPLRDEDLVQKLVTLAACGGSGCAPQPLIEALWAIGIASDAGAIMPLATGPMQQQ